MKRILTILSALMLTTVGAWSQASVTIETLPESAVGHSANLILNLDNEAVIKGFQADITLPDFVTFDKTEPQKMARVSAFEVAYKRITEHRMRIVVTSASNGELQPDSSAVVALPVTVAGAEEITDQMLTVSRAAAILENYRMVEIPDSDFLALEAKPAFILRYMLDGAEYHCDTLMRGELVNPAASPTKEGYTFSGWSGLLEVMPARDVTVTGSLMPNRYAVTYLLEGEPFCTDSVYCDEVLVTPEVPEKEWFLFTGWGDVPETMPACDLQFSGSYVLALELGDVNGDGFITVVDVTILTNEILKVANAVFARPAADLNSDDRISVVDVTMTTNKILEEKEK